MMMLFWTVATASARRPAREVPLERLDGAVQAQIGSVVQAEPGEPVSVRVYRARLTPDKVKDYVVYVDGISRVVATGFLLDGASMSIVDWELPISRPNVDPVVSFLDITCDRRPELWITSGGGGTWEHRLDLQVFTFEPTGPHRLLVVALESEPLDRPGGPYANVVSVGKGCPAELVVTPATLDPERLYEGAGVPLPGAVGRVVPFDPTARQYDSASLETPIP